MKLVIIITLLVCFCFININAERNTKDDLYICSINDVYKMWPLQDSGMTLDLSGVPIDIATLDLGVLNKNELQGGNIKTKKCLKLVPDGDITKENVQLVKGSGDTTCKAPHGTTGINPFPKALGGGSNFVYDYQYMRNKVKPAHFIATLPGDYLSPSFAAGKTEGRHMQELLNLAEIDIMTVGNHEFDHGGYPFLQDSLSRTRGPVLAYNLKQHKPINDDQTPNTKALQLIELMKDGHYGELKDLAKEELVNVIKAIETKFAEDNIFAHMPPVSEKKVKTGFVDFLGDKFKDRIDQLNEGIRSDLHADKDYEYDNRFTEYESCYTSKPCEKKSHRNPDWIVKEFELANSGKAKVCFFGVTEDKAALASGNKDLKKGNTFVDKDKNRVMSALSTVDKAVEVARAIINKGDCDVIVALTHTDFKNDHKIIKRINDAEWCKSNPSYNGLCLHAILSAHDHFPVYMDMPSDGKGTLFGKFGSDGKIIGCVHVPLKVAYDYKNRGSDEKPRPILKLLNVDVDADATRRTGYKTKDDIAPGTQVPSDSPKLLAQKALYAQYFYDTVTKSDDYRDKKCPLDHLKGMYDTHSSRDSETRALNYLADLVRYYLRTPVVIMQGGGIRGDIENPVGYDAFSQLDLLEEFPFTGNFGVIKISPNKLKEMVQNSKAVKTPDANWSHISGITAIFDDASKLVYLFLNPFQRYGRDLNLNTEADDVINLVDGDKTKIKMIFCDRENPVHQSLIQQHPELNQMCDSTEAGLNEKTIFVGSSKFHLTASAPTNLPGGPWGLVKGDMEGGIIEVKVNDGDEVIDGKKTPGGFQLFKACEGKQVKDFRTCGETCPLEQHETQRALKDKKDSAFIIGKEDGSGADNMHPTHRRFNVLTGEHRENSIMHLLNYPHDFKSTQPSSQSSDNSGSSSIADSATRSNTKKIVCNIPASIGSQTSNPCKNSMLKTTRLCRHVKAMATATCEGELKARSISAKVVKAEIDCKDPIHGKDPEPGTMICSYEENKAKTSTQQSSLYTRKSPSSSDTKLQSSSGRHSRLSTGRYSHSSGLRHSRPTSRYSHSSTGRYSTTGRQSHSITGRYSTTGRHSHSSTGRYSTTGRHSRPISRYSHSSTGRYSTTGSHSRPTSRYSHSSTGRYSTTGRHSRPTSRYSHSSTGRLSQYASQRSITHGIRSNARYGRRYSAPRSISRRHSKRRYGRYKVSFIEQKSKARIILRNSAPLRETASAILKYYTPKNAPVLLEVAENGAHFKSLHTNDISAFVEEAIAYGYPQEKKDWLHHYVEKAARYSETHHSNLKEHLKELHSGLSHLDVSKN